jgi:hypothetical protein
MAGASGPSRCWRIDKGLTVNLGKKESGYEHEYRFCSL